MGSEAGADQMPPHPSAGRLSEADGRRLRAALRLVFAPDPADRLAAVALADDDRDRGLQAAARAAEQRYALARLLRRFQPRSDPLSARPPLGPHIAAPARGAVDLALHVGFGLDAEALADLAADTPERVGELLLQARRAAGPAPMAACPELASALGRHRDRALDVGSRAALFHHVRECPACADALMASEAVDADLLQRTQAMAGDLPPLPARPSPRSPVERVVPAIAVVLLVGVLAVALTTLVEGMRGPASAPAAPLPRSPAHSLSGWLLTSSSDGAVSAVDLQTGLVRAVAPRVPSGRYVRRLLSPDGLLIASWTPPYGPNGPEPTGTLTVSHLDGTPLRSWGLGGGPGPGAGALVGWLGSSAVLVVQAPPWQGDQSPPAGLRGSQQQSQLVALDVATGEARVLFQGSISSVSASPDGTRLVVVQAYDQQWRGLTAELRAVNPQGLGPPLATIDHRLAPNSPVVWAPDSSRVFLARMTDAGPANGSAVVRSGPTTTEIDALGREGHAARVIAGTPGRLVYPVSASPGNARLVYVERGLAPVATTGHVWLAHGDGSRPASVAETAAPAGVDVAWLPDGTALLRDDLPFYLPADTAEQALGTVTWPVLLQVSPDGVARPAVAAPTAADGVGWLGWEPADALPAASLPYASPQPAAAAPESVALAGAFLGAGSSASPDGQLVTLTDPGLPGSVIWDAGSGSQARTLRGATDLSWVPGTQTLIGVSRGGSAGGGGSRVTLYAGGLAGSPALDLRHFDPAGIGDAPDRHYAAPQVAPDGLAISVFVVDNARRSAELWVSSWHGGSHMVARWTATSSALGAARPVARWASADVLLYAEPAGWQNGLPQTVAIQRVIARDGGAGSPATVAVVRAHGADRGIEVTDLALSPDGSRLAWRVRHLTGSDATSGLYDTLNVAPLANAADPVEITRTTPGDGLAWSPDGLWLAAGIGGRVSLLAPDGSVSVPLSLTGVVAAYPVWVGTSDVWYAEDDGSGNRTVRVRLQGP